MFVFMPETANTDTCTDMDYGYAQQTKQKHTPLHTHICNVPLYTSICRRSITCLYL